MSMLLGCIADDLTGATDLAMILVKEGMRVVQVVGVPEKNTPVPDADAVVVALKSRTIPADEAVEMSLGACDWLVSIGASQIFFKYCSTFDSTPVGNIGPVTDALMRKLGCQSTIACPAFPQNGRTVYNGYLFVNDGLLSESSLRNHPLTPMRDSNLNRVLTPQTSSQVSNITFADVDKGSLVLSEMFKHPTNGNAVIYIVDALTDDHLRNIGHACKELKLITGGSAVAQGLPDNYRSAGLLGSVGEGSNFTVPSGPTVILSGSCSEATLAQVSHAASSIPAFQLDVGEILAGKDMTSTALKWAEDMLKSNDAILIYSSAAPAEVSGHQKKSGSIDVGGKVEDVIGEIASGLKNRGIRRFVVAGGETSGSVINALKVKAMEIGPPIDPGVPWTKSIGDASLALALKSGNFGSEDFFIKAHTQLNRMASED